jgi:hypothetical protein
MRGWYEMIVTLKFHLNEEVTPEIFVRKIALACAKGGAIRTGEMVSTEDDSARFRAIEPQRMDYGMTFEISQWIEAA